jgi:signal transduction histidine kinase
LSGRPRAHVRPALVAGAALGIALGLAAERAATGFEHPGTWVPDLAVGWTFMACGLVAWDRRPVSRSGLLMVAAGAAWFLPNFALPSVPAVAWAADRTLFLYRGPLVHLLLAFPTGRTTSRLTRVSVVLGYAAALAPGVWGSDPAAIVLAALLVGVGFVEYRRSVGPARRARLWALRAQIVAATFLAGGAVWRLVVPNGGAVDASHLVFEISMCFLAVGLLVLVLVAPWERAAVTDLVVEMGEAPSDGLRDDLARALGDPSLEVGYRVPWTEALVDAQGRPLVLPEEGTDRAVTSLRHGDQEVAVLVHDRSVLDDPALLEAVSAAAQLAAANARLQAEVRARVDQLAASRLRLLEAGDEERRRLERRLHEGAERRLEDIATVVQRARAEASGPASADRLGLVEADLRETRDDLDRLGRGLHPRELTELGLEGALRALAVRAPVQVSVSVRTTPVAASVEAATYYLCAEALANIAKHAGATSASIVVVQADSLLAIDVADDGVGGADGARGSGLRGLVDRIETLGGSLSITSPGGEGTRLAARIPLQSGGTA